jgi:hypothetical protein
MNLAKPAPADEGAKNDKNEQTQKITRPARAANR